MKDLIFFAVNLLCLLLISLLIPLWAAQIKLAQPSPPSSSSSSAAAAAAASYSMETPAQNHPPPPPSHSSPPPPPGKESFARRYKFLWPVLLTVPLAVGAFLFMRTSKKETETAEQDSKVALAPPASSSVPSTASMADKSPYTPPVVQPVIKREPIPPSQQLELFKWMLEEKRKIKPKDSEERKRVDEEKAILKQFLLVKSLPNL